MYIRKNILAITVFLCGAIVMILELVGARILGPYIGTSIFVWTTLIGIVMGSLSLGYYRGGKIADKHPEIKYISLIVFGAALMVGAIFFVKDTLLVATQTIQNIQLTTFITTIVLFAPTSILLGMVSPYAVKLKVAKLKNSGSTVGNLSALATLGSIVGTFLCGYMLIPLLGANSILLILVVTLILLSIAIAPHYLSKTKRIVLIIFLLVEPAILLQKYFHVEQKNLEIDTLYNHLIVQDHGNIRTLLINNETNSAMYLDKNNTGLVYEYTKYYDLAQHFLSGFSRALMIGGGGYSYPKHFLSTYPQATLDVIEIDPMITEIARQKFNLKNNPRLQIYHEDGRTFLNTTKKIYDVIFIDAFRSEYTIPFQLTTKEAVQKIYDILTDSGLVMMNIIGSLEGDPGRFLRAEYATYKSIFPQVYLFPLWGDRWTNQNIMLVATKTTTPLQFESNNSSLNSFLSKVWKDPIPLDMPILTDDYAPVDNYIRKQ